MCKVDLTGRVAIVTGAGSGLGRSYAIDLAKHGAKVIVNDIGSSKEGNGSNGTPAMKVVGEIKASGGIAFADFSDVVTNAGDILKSAIAAFGTVDILVNNAGIIRDSGFGKMDEEAWDSVLDVHLKGTYACTKAVWPVMKEKKYGRIVNISSRSGLFGNFGQANYAAAKSAIIGLSNVLKIEGARNNILVNVVAPIAASRMTQDMMSEEVINKSRPELVAPIVTYLCSEKCVETGAVFIAGLGSFTRAAMMTGPGWVGNGNITADDILSNFDKINSLENPKYHHQLEKFVV